MRLLVRFNARLGPLKTKRCTILPAGPACLAYRLARPQPQLSTGVQRFFGKKAVAVTTDSFNLIRLGADFFEATDNIVYRPQVYSNPPTGYRKLLNRKSLSERDIPVGTGFWSRSCCQSFLRRQHLLVHLDVLPCGPVPGKILSHGSFLNLDPLSWVF